MERNITTKLIRLEDVKFPLVEVAFKDAEGKICIGYLLVDTGSVNCILNKTVVPFIVDSQFKADEKLNVFTVQNQVIQCQGIDFTFFMGGEKFDDTFYVNEQVDFSEMFDKNFIGIIGHQFLRKHKLVIDYAEQTLRSSDGSGCIGNNGFVYPMSKGLDEYNLPIVRLCGETQDHLFVVDSGSNATVLSQKVLADCKVEKVDEDNEGSITCFNNANFETSFQTVSFELRTLMGDVFSKKVFLDEEVEVLHHHDYLIENIKNEAGEVLQPLSGLLSSDFMLRHKWILDFGVGLMYSA